MLIKGVNPASEIKTKNRLLDQAEAAAQCWWGNPRVSSQGKGQLELGLVFKNIEELNRVLF